MISIPSRLTTLPGRSVIVAMVVTMVLGTAAIVPFAHAAGPTASARFLVAGGAGDQIAPSLSGNTLVYTSCVDPANPCKVMAEDLSTKQSYAIASANFGLYARFEPGANTDGVSVAWTDEQGVHVASLVDYSTSIASSVPGKQSEVNVSGNIVVWSDNRGKNSLIYMYDMSTGKETRISDGPGDQRSPVTNGKVIAWEAFQPANPHNGMAPLFDVFGYDIATKTQFLISKDSYEAVMSGNTVILGGSSAYDLSTRKPFSLGKNVNIGRAASISGNIIVWEEPQNPNEEMGPGFTDIYGYDLSSKQKFPIAVGANEWHERPVVSGNLVVWQQRAAPGGDMSKISDTDLFGSTLNGVTPLPIPPLQHPTSRAFSQTGKTVSGAFLDYWNKNGGLAQQGYPISNVMQEVSDLNGKPYQVQYFERAVFEQHPENKPPYDVLLSQLGTFRYKQKYPDASKAAPGPGPGSITGSVSFPSEGIPAFQIYAIPTQGGMHFYTATKEDQGNYTINGIAPGSYYVVAYTNNPGGLEKLPYTTDSGKTLAIVTVKSGITTKGIDLGDVVGPPQIPPQPSPDSRCFMFKETSKTLCGKFLQYWLAHGDIPQQGFPISDQMQEKSDLNGQTYTVQYFERAVFELHPENKPPYDVLLSQLGTFRYKQKYQQPSVAPTPAAATPRPTIPAQTQTPLPTATTQQGTPVPGSLNGEWVGTTSQGTAVSFTIKDSAFTRYDFPFTGVNGCQENFGCTCPAPLTGSSFTLDITFPTQSIVVTGTFNSSTLASGNIKAQGSCIADLTWTATKK